MTHEAAISHVNPNRTESREIAAIYNIDVSSENAKHILNYIVIYPLQI